MVSARGPLLVLVGLVVSALLAVFALRATGEDLGDLWHELALPLAVLAACLALLSALALASAAVRLRCRRLRGLARYQLVLSQADEAPREEVAAACEQLIQTVRASTTERLSAGQPWLALESWFLPPQRAGETGAAALILICHPATRDRALAALRHAYPDLTLRPDPRAADGKPLELLPPTFTPGHVLRVRKSRDWPLPLGGPGERDASNARSTMAAIIRQQQQAGRLSCVRWCVMPAADSLDSRAAAKLERFAGSPPNAARAGDVQQALERAGGAMSFLELQAAVERRRLPVRRGRGRPESFAELQSACRLLLAPALSHRGANHLTERLMVARQRLYRRRWARAEPPLLPDPSGSTLVSPRELALLMELPSLGSEHALPLQRNTVPHLPIPTEVPRARTVELAVPDDRAAKPGAPGGPGQDGIVDAELVFDEEAAR